MRLQGTNFQSHAEFDLNIDGLTVVVGPSNKGKSALFRALKGLFRNDLPESFVRTGTNELKLTAKLEGHTITATRSTKSAAKYVIDGEKFDKLGGKIPVELKAFGMNDVKVGDYTIDPIFSKQNGKQFLLDTDSPMELNTILGAFASTEKLESGKKAANLEVQHKNAEAKALAEEIGDAEQRKADLEALTVQMDDVEHVFRRLEPEIFILETKSEWLREAEHRQTYLWPLKHVLTKLEIPDLGEVERLSSAYNYGVQATNAFRLSKFLSKTQTAIELTVNAMAEINGMVETIEAVHDVLALHGKAAPAYQLVSDFAGTTKVLEDGLIGLRRIEESIIALRTCAELQLNFKAVQHEKIQNEIDIMSVEVLLAKAVDAAKAEDVSKIACPQCGYKFRPEGASNA